MTLINITVFSSALLGFIALALAMPKHSKAILRRPLSTQQNRLLRLGGWLLLAVALCLGIAQWHAGIGTATWLGWLTVAGVALVFSLPKWATPPRQRKASRPPPGEQPANTAPRRNPLLLIALLLLPACAFSWQLLNTPDKPLLRKDAVSGEIGPWSFTLAEKDQRRPEIVAMDVPLKAFTIRFCDGCDAQIRMAYLKIRQPRSSRALGNAFEGRGAEKTAEIPIPRAAVLSDGIWLTVESNNGEIYQREFPVKQLSPALASFIGERS